MLSMVWHVEVPGTHTVTEVNSVLTLSLVGPAVTATLATLGPDGVVPVPVELEPEPPMVLPPPQAAMPRDIRDSSVNRLPRQNLIRVLPPKHRSAPPAASKHGR